MKIHESITNTRAINAGKAFTTKANYIHNNKYDYSLAVYKGARESIVIKCPTHGVFNQRPNDHLAGSGCPTCGNKAAADKLKYSLDSFIRKAMVKHKNKYSYAKTVYISSSTPIVITCPIHGDFKQKPWHHLAGAGCQECAAIAVSKATSLQNKSRMDTHKFISLSKTKYGNNYSYDNTKYSSWQEPITITCNLHGDFTLRAGSHLAGLGGCKECARKHMGNGRSYFRGKPTILYVLELPGQLFKVGITTRGSVEDRYKEEPKGSYSVIFQTTFLDGEEAFDLELQTKRMFKLHGYVGPTMFKYTGNTEIFTTSPLSYITKSIRNTMKDYFTVQMVKHVNYTAFVEASTQEEAEQLAIENTSNYDWIQMDGLHPTEICTLDGGFEEGELLS